MRFSNGLTIGGPITWHHVAEVFDVPIASLHRPNLGVWSWAFAWFRYRKSSGCVHKFFRITRQPGAQSHTMIDVLWLGAFRWSSQRQMVLDELRRNESQQAA